MPQMPQAPDWQRVLEAGMQFTEMRRSQARAVANDLVAQGHLAREQVAAAVDDILDMSRRRTDDLRGIVRKEVQRQLSALGVATKGDLERLERRLARVTKEAKKADGVKAAKKKPAAKKTAAAS